MNALRPSPLRELRAYMRLLARRCQTARWYGALFHVGVASTIVEDLAKTHRSVADTAHRAELTAEAIKRKVAEITADGQVTAEELTELNRVPAQLQRVESDCHDIGDAVRF